MKTKLIPLSFVTVGVLLTACSEQPADKPATPPAAQTAPVGDAASGAADAAQKAAGQVQQAAQPAAAAVTEAGSAVAAKVKEVVGQAQGLLSQGKLQEAQDALKGLTDLKLTPDQQKLVDDLKAKIQQAMAAAKAGGADPAKAVQGLLPKGK